MYFWAAKRILDSRVIGLLLHSLRVVVSSFRVVKVVVGVKILTHMKKMMNDAFVRDRLCWLRGLGHHVAHIAPHYIGSVVWAGRTRSEVVFWIEEWSIEFGFTVTSSMNKCC